MSAPVKRYHRTVRLSQKDKEELVQMVLNALDARVGKTVRTRVTLIIGSVVTALAYVVIDRLL